MAKRVRLSDDDGVSWATLPGNSAELSSEAGELSDTIFGQNFDSTFPGINGWTINANALYKGYAGYQAKILKSGTPTALTTEAMSNVSGKVYVITDTAKRMLDRTTAIQVFDGVDDKTSEVLSIDWLFGRIEFKSTYTVTGSVTITGKYLPVSVVGCANEYTLTQTANAIDNTCMDTAQQNNGHRTFEYGLKTVSLELSGIYKTANNFLALLQSRAELIIEINPDGAGMAVARGFFRAVNTGQSGDVGDLEQENITFNLSVPDQENVETPFKWMIAGGSLLSNAIKIAIAAWENEELVRVAYLPDGTNGVEGDAVITDLTLTGGLEAMNEFTVNLQGSDALDPHP